MKPRYEHDGVKSIQKWISTASDKEIAELAVFLNEVMLSKESRTQIIRDSIGIK